MDAATLRQGEIEMAVLDVIRQLFSKKNKDKAFNPLSTSWIMDRIKMSDIGDEKALRPLPIVGHLPYRQQMVLLLSSLIISGVLFVVLLFGIYLFTSHYATLRSTATEMQVLSQRIARSSSSGLQGNPDAFTTLETSVSRFETNLDLIANESGLWLNQSSEKTANVEKIQAVWKENFQPSKDRPNLHTILKHKQALTSIAKSVAGATANDGELTTIISVLIHVQPVYDEITPTTGKYLEQLPQINLRVVKNASLLSSGDTSTRKIFEVLSNDVALFNSILRGLREGNPSLGITAVHSVGLLNAISEIERLSRPFNDLVSLLNTSSQSLDEVHLANKNIVRDSEVLLGSSAFLADLYETKTHTLGANVFLLLLAVTALGSLYLLVRVFNQEAVRRRMHSEMENRRNQDAILRLLNDMADLADGDLTVRAAVTEDLTGAIADSINYTIEELRALITEINRATEQVTRVTGQAQEVSSELLVAAERQSHEIEDTSQTVGQIVHSIQEVSSSATESSRVAQASLSAAEQGAEAVNNQIKGMNEIREQIQETSKRIKRLGESSQEIGEIVELISDITEQTNVLALNAAIQAAAAGDAGRGFSVVAEEVQRLAERSGEATKQIGAIVKVIQADTHDAVAAMELSTQGVVEGAKLSDAAGTALSEIGRVSRELARLIQSIAHETEEQTQLSARVNVAMRDILAITEQTTTGVKSSAEAVAQMSGLAGELKNSVSGFKL
ncbi:MAG: methyl-accepting chemotaxis protein [Proteobacteria bacterium]|nr:methyl-accepting chemotaxis protein [Pseudomonadota bacterium]